MDNNKKCPDGYVWCPITNKCITKKEMEKRRQGLRMGRGTSKGPLGQPYKEACDMVDGILLNGDFSYKAILKVDRILDEIENQIDNIPDQDIEDLHDDVVDEVSKDENQKEKAEVEESNLVEPSVVEASFEDNIKKSLHLLVREDDYREFFKGMLKKWNINAPTDLDAEKKKEFFNFIDKEWKAKKESD